MIKLIKRYRVETGDLGDLITAREFYRASLDYNCTDGSYTETAAWAEFDNYDEAVELSIRWTNMLPSNAAIN